MKGKTNKKIKGFMCQSPAATAVCMTGDKRSVIVPRRPDRSSSINRAHTMLIDSNYNHLLESQRFSPFADKHPMMSRQVPPLPLSSFLKDRDRKQKPSSLTSSASNPIFQVVVMRVSLHCQGCAGKE
ncbi:uncharacterized protein LOC122090499 isoform X2 [Macadamia integrifolia]|uniref:uncharacterized protein LOC122090499 isoform X2 n=1 Tax=Macadamia integrifolia TaxID=60698 RepID=UPI001C4E3765|nr:uncharacterized protein LOC122090499 isoform X2 [Macadamia integrifolia]